MSKRMVYLYATDEQIKQFSIGYMINPSLHINKVFRYIFLKRLKTTFNENTMENIRYVMKNKGTCVIAKKCFMRIKEQNQKKCIGC